MRSTFSEGREVAAMQSSQIASLLAQIAEQLPNVMRPKTYTAEETMEQIFCEMVEADPDFALFLGLMAMVAEAFDDEPTPDSIEVEFTDMSLLDILGAL